VRAIPPAERAAFKALPFDEAGFIRESGAPMAWGENGYTTLERTTVRPTLDVNGLWGGYQDEGARRCCPRSRRPR